MFHSKQQNLLYSIYILFSGGDFVEQLQMLSFDDLSAPSNVPILKELLEACQASDATNDLCSLQPYPSIGTLEYCFCSAYAFIDGVNTILILQQLVLLL